MYTIMLINRALISTFVVYNHYYLYISFGIASSSITREIYHRLMHLCNFYSISENLTLLRLNRVII